MEPLNTQQKQAENPTVPLSNSAEKALEELLKSTKEHQDTIIISATPEGKPVIHHTKNLYPTVRHIFLIIVVLLFLTLIIFLMHQNGKSIYDNGL